VDGGGLLWMSVLRVLLSSTPPSQKRSGAD
jgi:hypothetical protein